MCSWMCTPPLQRRGLAWGWSLSHLHTGSSRSYVIGWNYPGKMERAEGAFLKARGNRILLKQNLEETATAGTQEVCKGQWTVLNAAKSCDPVVRNLTFQVSLASYMGGRRKTLVRVSAEGGVRKRDLRLKCWGWDRRGEISEGVMTKRRMCQARRSQP